MIRSTNVNEIITIVNDLICPYCHFGKAFHHGLCQCGVVDDEEETPAVFVEVPAEHDPSVRLCMLYECRGLRECHAVLFVPSDDILQGVRLYPFLVIVLAVMPGQLLHIRLDALFIFPDDERLLCRVVTGCRGIDNQPLLALIGETYLRAGDVATLVCAVFCVLRSLDDFDVCFHTY